MTMQHVNNMTDRNIIPVLFLVLAHALRRSGCRSRTEAPGISGKAGAELRNQSKGRRRGDEDG
jgi:hypothetical protein